MKRFAYYPGCSLEGTAREYDRATRALMAGLGVGLEEIPQWSCCGASAAEAASELLSLALPARNLALAEQMPGIERIMVPCSACYLNLERVVQKTRYDTPLRDRINAVLAADNLRVSGRVQVSHLLEVLARDVDPAVLEGSVRYPLVGLKVAPYYGCQCLRPYPRFDDPERPASMDSLIRAVGAEVLAWDKGPVCCGAALMTTKPEVGIHHVAGILAAARDADVIVTVCPMCQMNLEAHQGRISRIQGQDLTLSVLYLPQLLGLALGMDEKALGLDQNLALTQGLKTKIADLRQACSSG